MVASAVSTSGDFFRSFMMGRRAFDPRDYGIDLDREAFTDILVEHLSSIYHGEMTIDELCLNPREALHFCDMVRREHGWYYLPDDIILRPIMVRRKNP